MAAFGRHKSFSKVPPLCNDVILGAFEVSSNSSPKNNKSKDVTAWQAF